MKTLFETTAEIMGEDFFELMGEVEPAMPGVYVCANESEHHGASFTYFDPEKIDRVIIRQLLTINNQGIFENK